VSSRLDLTSGDLSALLAPEPAFRARQVRLGLLKGLDPSEMTDLSLDLRHRLSSLLPAPLRVERELVGEGAMTLKWLWALADGAHIETVLMHYPHRSTVCVSTQAGCAMGCSFCATGQMGFLRHLSAGEIVEQVTYARRAAHPRRLSNVVFMGMGEPLANYEATIAAATTIQGELAISARHITVSTVGVAPGIRRLAREALPVNLAVSLHAAHDELRNTLVPLNRRYPLAELMDACEEYRGLKGRRVSFEWALIDDVNDGPDEARRLIALARPLRAHVNLIPLNPTQGYRANATAAERAGAFCRQLVAGGIEATVRANRGRDIDAACGQLALPTRARRTSVDQAGSDDAIL